MNRKYEIMTEMKNKEGIRRIVSDHFSGFTISCQSGFGKGEHENSLCITIIGGIVDIHAVIDIARRIKTLNEQESVLVVKTNVNRFFV